MVLVIADTLTHFQVSRKVEVSVTRSLGRHSSRHSSVLTSTQRTMTMMKFLTCLLLTMTTLSLVHGFAPHAHGSRTQTSLAFFGDVFKKAFGNEAYGAPADEVRATARHILVKRKEDLTVVTEKLRAGASFANCAKEYSSCPSGSQGGSLGSFKPGTMVPEFDKVIFSPDTKIGEVVGPVQTQFGYHLIVVDKRKGGGDWY
jgi:peptidyl-prolyl cis-trans isomerase C